MRMNMNHNWPRFFLLMALFALLVTLWISRAVWEARDGSMGPSVCHASFLRGDTDAG